MYVNTEQRRWSLLSFCYWYSVENYRGNCGEGGSGESVTWQRRDV